MAREERHQGRLDLHWIVLRDEAEAVAQPQHVGVDDDSFVDGKRVAEDDVRRLSADAGQLDECLHVARHVAAVASDERVGHRDEVRCLAAEEASTPNHLLDILLSRGGERCGVGIPHEERWGDHVDAFVCALRAQNRRDEQLESVAVVECAMRVGVRALEPRVDLRRTSRVGFDRRAFGELRLARRLGVLRLQQLVLGESGLRLLHDRLLRGLLRGLRNCRLVAGGTHRARTGHAWQAHVPSAGGARTRGRRLPHAR